MIKRKPVEDTKPALKAPAAKTSAPSAPQKPAPKQAPEESADEFLSGLMTSPEEIEEVRKKMETTSDGQLWRHTLTVKSGTSKTVMLKWPAIGKVALHTVNKRMPDGRVTGEKRICSASKGQPCGYCDAGMRPILYTVFQVVDIAGYKKKDGKRVSNEVKYYIVNDARLKVLEMFAKNVGDPAKFKKFPVEIESTGSGANTVHTYDLKDDESLTDAAKTAKPTISQGKVFGAEEYTVQEKNAKISNELRGERDND